MKKIIALILSLIMIFSVAMPAMAVGASDPVIDNPLVYIRGAGKELYRYG